jgi:uncharacterized membrane protein
LLTTETQSTQRDQRENKTGENDAQILDICYHKTKGGAMHPRRGQFILSLLAIIFGAALMVVGQTQRPVWAAGGGFFIAIGVASLLMTLGWVLPGWAGKALRHPIFNAIAVLAVISTLLLTVYYAFVR